MVRIFLVIFCFLSYGNFNYLVDNLLIFSLINIGFYSFLKEKKLDLFDFIIFILSTYLVELFLGLPLFISVVTFSLPLLALSYIINNFSVHYSINSIFIFILSLLIFYFLYPEVVMTLKIKDYLLYFLVLIFLSIGLRLDGKEQS
ncbi:MAG: hypothetical protein ACJ0RK_03330 [Alphaproteobacteria bacterium]|tara:strand:- start:857 stop:1291 length:435 start_codon:yes stop_codon:yes gene_type:complete